MRRDPIYLLDIAVACRLIKQLTDGVSYPEFLKNIELQLALEKLLENIGEAASHVTQEQKDELPSIPWSQMTGMRNILIHQYFRINLAEVWETARVKIPEVLEQLEPHIPPEV